MKTIYAYYVMPLILLLLTCFNTLNAQINVNNIDIVRDKWGVPHIYGHTDAETAYGLAWAGCEDDFKTTQQMLLAVRGKLGEVNGKNGAIFDFLVYIIGADRMVPDRWDTILSPAYKKVLSAYVEGLNAFAAAHPDKVLRKELFPVHDIDILKEDIWINTMLTSVYVDIQKIFQGYISHYEVNYPSGSNGWAFNSYKTKEGKTFLGVNSHQPVDGLFSFYEAHLNSDEGMNMLGCTFNGLPSLLEGANTQLGWGCTLNHPDMDDVYKLDMNPNNPLQYWFDDHWETLEVRKKTIKVKVGAGLVPVTRTFYWSRYGTTIANKDGFYAIRFPANMDIRSTEQLYRMNKAANFTQWRNAMRMGSIPGMNFVYADRNDTTFYVSTGQFAYRNPAYDWKHVLPGNTSATLWAPVFHPFDEMPQILNPKSGWLVNTNNTCFDVTAPADNLKPGNYDPTFGFGTDENNRSIMAHYLIGKYNKLSYDDFKRIKYNREFNDSMYEYSLNNINVLMNLNPVKYPDLADAIAVVKSWNHGSEPDNKEAALVDVALFQIIDKLVDKGVNYEANSCSEKEYAAALRAAKKHMLKYFGSLRVPLGDVQKHVRGNVVLPIGGVPEVLAANISEPYKNGMRKSNVGESYIELVRYSKDTVEIESVSPFGASNDPASRHYTDQMQMFVDQKLKPMTLDRATIYKNAESIYHPGKPNHKGKDRDTVSQL